MRIYGLLLLAILFSCGSLNRKYNHYKGKPRAYLINQEGLPNYSLADGINEKLIYVREKKIHNPKYVEVYEYTYFFVDSNKIVQYWKKQVVKTKVFTPPESTAIY